MLKFCCAFAGTKPRQRHQEKRDRKRESSRRRGNYGLGWGQYRMLHHLDT